MALDPISAILETGSTIIDKIWPDADEAEKRKLELASIAASGDMQRLQAEVKLLAGQIEINKIDATSQSKFQAWWRPAIGWVGAVSLFLMYVPKALVMTYIWTVQAITMLNAWDGSSNLVVPAFPDLGVSDIIGLVMALLGVASMRSYDKKQGTNTKK